MRYEDKPCERCGTKMEHVPSIQKYCPGCQKEMIKFWNSKEGRAARSLRALEQYAVKAEKKPEPENEEDYLHGSDSPERIAKCLNCTAASCFNCYERPAAKPPRPKLTLTPEERLERKRARAREYSRKKWAEKKAAKVAASQGGQDLK